MQFPVWRELKLINGPGTHCDQFCRLNAVSRLKGIETFQSIFQFLSKVKFECSFPFEGNWNCVPVVCREYPLLSVWMQFPVWRELKLPLSWDAYFASTVWMQFPVWRELKLAIPLTIMFLNAFKFECSFPFEGNWNFGFFSTITLPPRSLNAVSRLKGIETTCYFLSTAYCNAVWMQFPVWRELKLGRLSIVSRKYRTFECSFPFEGNWNLVDDLDRMYH